MLSNITSINLDLQTQGSALVAKQINALVSPARRIYVFGTATDAFPYFSTFANALTYANSLTPSTTNPVSIVLLSNTNGTPVEISGADDWYALCLDGIYVSSPYREIFSTTTLPTTLPKGMRVMYEDANGVESLWVGNADGVAWPAVGYKEISGFLTQTSTNAPTAVILKNDFVSPEFNRINVGEYEIVFNGGAPFVVGKTYVNPPYNDLAEQQYSFFFLEPAGGDISISFRTCDISSFPSNPETDGYLSNTPFWIRAYP